MAKRGLTRTHNTHILLNAVSLPVLVNALFRCDCFRPYNRGIGERVELSTRVASVEIYSYSICALRVSGPLIGRVLVPLQLAYEMSRGV
jgi:hypothetical protein